MCNFQLGFNIIAAHVSNCDCCCGMFFDFQLTTSPLPGDANGDGNVDLSDAAYILGCLFRGTACPQPIALGDFNCSSEVDVSDPIYLLFFLFRNGPVPRTCL